VARFAVVSILPAAFAFILAACSGQDGSASKPAAVNPGSPASDSARIETVDDALREMAAGRFESAIGILGPLLDRDTSTARLYDMMGQCMAEVGYCGQAGTFFKKGLRIDSSNVALLTHAAQSAVNCGYAGEARGYYLALSRLRPGDVKTQIALARLAIQESDYEGALGSLAAALDADSTSLAALYLTGSSLAALKRSDQAIEALKLALLRQPGYIPAIRDLAWLYYQAELYGESTIMYQQGLDLQPSSTVFRIGLANSLFKRTKYRDAIPLYRAAEEGPFLETSVYQQGLCYFYLGSYDTAKVLLGRAIAIDTTNVGAHYNLGLALMNLADYGAAVRSFGNAIRRSRSDIITSSYDRIGVANYELGLRGAAVKAFRKAIDENPRNARAWYDLGVLFENLSNDRAQAMECYRKVVSIEQPSDEEGSLYFRARERIRILRAASKQ
jgi:tetratricopeptide (TPR) repeat protein